MLEEDEESGGRGVIGIDGERAGSTVGCIGVETRSTTVIRTVNFPGPCEDCGSPGVRFYFFRSVAGVFYLHMRTPPAKTSLLIRGAVPIVFQRELAHAIGLNQAIVLQELAYLFDKTKSGKVIDGERWIYNTYEEWQENFFPFFSVGTLARIIQDLEKRRLLLSCQPEGGISRRKYYRLGEGAVGKLTIEMYGEQQRLPKTADEEPNLVVEGRKLNGSGSAQNESFDDANCVLPLERSEESSEGSTNTIAPTAKFAPVLVARERNLVLDALATVGGGDPLQVTSWAGHAKALKDIRAVAPQVTAEEIVRRGENYRLHFERAALTSGALAKHWATCDKPPPPQRNHHFQRQTTNSMVDDRPDF